MYFIIRVLVATYTCVYRATSWPPCLSFRLGFAAEGSHYAILLKSCKVPSTRILLVVIFFNKLLMRFNWKLTLTKWTPKRKPGCNNAVFNWMRVNYVCETFITTWLFLLTQLWFEVFHLSGSRISVCTRTFSAHASLIFNLLQFPVGVKETFTKCERT